MAKYGAEEVFHRDGWSLMPREWLNDNVINYVTRYIRDENFDENDSAYIIRSHFFTALYKDVNSKPDFKQVKSWSKHIFAERTYHKMKTLVFFRNISNFHWSCYVIFVDFKTIQCFDSMGSNDEDEKIMGHLYKWLNIEVHSLGIELNRDDWYFNKATDRGIPCQPNGFDCGMYMFLFGVCTAKRLPLSLVTQELVDAARKCLMSHFIEKERESAKPEVVNVNSSPPPAGKNPNPDVDELQNRETLDVVSNELSKFMSYY